jgi:hypothetical protein
VLRLDRVAEGHALVDHLVGSATLADPGNWARLLELAQDSLRGPLRDADSLGDLTGTA